MKTNGMKCFKFNALTFFFKIIASSLLFLNFFVLKAQTEQDNSYKQMYAYGVNFNSQDGIIGGLTFRYAKMINNQMYHNFSIEIVDIKHQQEQRTTSPITGEFYVPGKKNYLYVIRPQYGREWIMLKKRADKGVQLSLIGAAGPSIGLVSPYMIQYSDNNGTIIRTTQYDPSKNISFSSILGTGSIGESLSAAQFQFGGSAKLSFALEFGVSKNNFLGMELGGMIDVYPKNIDMMAFSQNKSFYSCLFVTFFGGIGK